MRSLVVASILLVMVIGIAVFRSRSLPATDALPGTDNRLTIIAVENLDVQDISVLPRFSAYGVMPSRNGTAYDSDFDAGLRMLVSGTRTPGRPDRTVLNLPDTSNNRLHFQSIRGINPVPELRSQIQTVFASESDTLLIIGVTPTGSALSRRERITPLLYWNRSLGTDAPRLLTSPSTRTYPGLVAATDIATTIATLVNAPADKRTIGAGRAIELTSRILGSSSIETYLIRCATSWGQQSQQQKLLPILPVLLALAFPISLLASHRTVRTIFTQISLSIPLSLVIAPLFVYPFTGVPPILLFIVALIVVLLIAISLSRYRVSIVSSARILAIATVVVIATDLCTGGWLLGKTPLSYSVLEAARYYGIGNELSGLFLGAAIIAIGKDRRPMVAAIYGCTIAAISGLPVFGADAGGLIATLAAIAAMITRGGSTDQRTKVDWRRLAMAGLLIATFVFLFAIWEGSRPAIQRTHIGEAVVQAQQHGVIVLLQTITRKLAVNAHLLFVSPWSLLLGAQMITLVVIRIREKRPESITRSPVAFALLIAQIALFILNDSGVVAGATCGIWWLAVRSDNRP